MHSYQLPIPPAADKDAKARELLRVWASGGSQHVSIAAGLWDDPANWGIVLVDLAKHVANAYEQSAGMTYENALQRLRAGFDAEWGTSTAEPKGKLLEREKGTS